MFPVVNYLLWAAIIKTNLTLSYRLRKSARIREINGQYFNNFLFMWSREINICSAMVISVCITLQ